jgi:hypothetical protein
MKLTFEIKRIFRRQLACGFPAKVSLFFTCVSPEFTSEPICNPAGYAIAKHLGHNCIVPFNVEKMKNYTNLIASSDNNNDNNIGAE